MRSLLFVPGDSEKKLEKGFGAGADVVIVDLEDSVAPQNKGLAREIAAHFIVAHRQQTSAAIYVRVNDLSTGLTDDDLAALLAARPDGIMLPKSNNGQDVQHLSAKLRVHEAENGLPDGAIRILPIITETAAGVLAAATYAGTSPRLAGLTWGAEDLSASIGARAARDERGRYTDVFRFARTMTILAAGAAEVAAIDTVFPNFRDMAAFETECTEAERDGFTGKMAIHPAQVPVINAAFTPSAEAVKHSASIVAAFEAAGNPGVV
ncbi:MAG: CoA ester lyase, partial [Mesorhizobium sp.]